MAINPHGMTLRQFADATILSVGDTYSFGRLDNDADWKTWATGFIRASPYSQRRPPDPAQFTDWRDWAQRMYSFLEGAT